MSRYIHIVCLDAPSPPDYGGAIDMFYKIQALGQLGKKIILHYFDYHPSRNSNGLDRYCVAIHVYKRKSIFRSLPLSQPFIVQSRVNQELIDRLNEDDYPILLEGLHCSGITPFLKHPGRIILRMHNEEASYYRHLATTERTFLKKSYFLQESKLLRKYQQQFPKDIKLACLSEADMAVFQNVYGFEQASFVPCFIPWQDVSINDGRNDYCLYHGNMLVSENEEAALWLIHHVFCKTSVRLVIAGKGISKRVMKAAGPYTNISLVHQPSIDEIEKLVREAHINVLPSMNNTGVKLKLLNALLNGRYCITNQQGVKGSKIKNGVFVEEDGDNWITRIEKLMPQNFTTQQKEERKEILAIYNNEANAQTLSALWKHYQ